MSDISNKIGTAVALAVAFAAVSALCQTAPATPRLPGFPDKIQAFKIEDQNYVAAWVGAAVPVQRKGYNDASVILVPLSPLAQPARALRMAAPYELVRPISVQHQGLHMKARLVAEEPGEYTVTIISENIRSIDQRCMLAFSLEGRILWDQPLERDKAVRDTMAAKMTFDITEPGLYDAVALLSCVLAPSVGFADKTELNANRPATDEFAPIFRVVLQHNGKIVPSDRPTFVSSKDDFERAAAGMRASSASGAGKASFSKSDVQAKLDIPPGKVPGWRAEEARFTSDQKLRLYDLGTTRSVPASGFRQAPSDWAPPPNATVLQQWQPAFKLSGTFIARATGEYVIQHRVTSSAGRFDLTEEPILAVGEDVQQNLLRTVRNGEAIEVPPITKTTGIWRLKLDAGRVYDLTLLAGVLAYPDNTMLHEVLVMRPGEAGFTPLRDDEIVHDKPR